MEKFDAEIIEPEEKQSLDFNPLDEPVEEKPYSIPNVNTSGINMNIPIEEPKFAPPPLNNRKEENVKPPKAEPINPEMKHLGKKDTDMAAGHMAKLVIQGYEWMHDLGNKALQFNERKLTKLQADGEINLNAMIDYDYGKKIRAGDFFSEYNAQIKDILTVSQEFKDEVMPILERVLAKRGVGMTDEQMLIFLFGKDIAAKSMIFFQQKTQMNMILASIKEATTGMYAQKAPESAPPPPPPPPPPPSPSPSPAASAKYEVLEPEEYELSAVPAPKKNQRGRPRKI